MIRYDIELISLKKPFLHLVISNRSDFYDYAWKWFFYEEKKVVSRIIRGWKATTVDELFNEFGAALQFWDYFGENWPAFDDCINDLDWLPADAYLIFISDIDKVLEYEQADFKTFTKKISRAIKEWTEGRTYNPSFPTPPTPFHVFLNCSKDKEEATLKRLADAGINEFDIIRLSSDEKTE